MHCVEFSQEKKNKAKLGSQKYYERFVNFFQNLFYKFYLSKNKNTALEFKICVTNFVKN